MPRRWRVLDALANELPQLARLREASVCLRREHHLAVNRDVELPTAARHERYLRDVVGERVEELLGDPAGARQEVALHAVRDRDGGAVRCGFAHRDGRLPTTGPIPRTP